MVRGKTFFKCPHCGRVFRDWDIEYCCTIYSTPMPCPDCGTKSPAANLLDLLFWGLSKKILNK